MLLPVIVLSMTLLVVGRRVSRHGLPVDDIGLWTIAVTWLYGALPVIAFLIFGQDVGLFDLRLLHIQPTSSDISRVSWYYALYMVTFAGAYLIARKRPVPTEPLLYKRRYMFAVVPTLICTLVFLWLVTPESDTYTGSYSAVNALPLGLRQIFGVATTARFVLVILALLFMFSRHRIWWLPLWVWIIAQFGSAITAQGSRTGLMATLAVCVVLYDRFVRRVTAWQAISLAVIGVVVFLVLGMVRAGAGVFVPGEFLSVFTNAIDLHSRQPLSVPLGVYLTEFFSIVPSQLWPIEKIDAATWYVTSFYPDHATAGGGLAFGVVAQGVIGLGIAEIAVRGLLMGWLSAVVFRWYRNRSANIWVTTVYLWLLVFSYQSIRATSLILFGPLLQRLLPLFLFLWAFGQFLQAIHEPNRRLEPSPSFGS